MIKRDYQCVLKLHTTVGVWNVAYKYTIIFDLALSRIFKFCFYLFYFKSQI